MGRTALRVGKVCKIRLSDVVRLAMKVGLPMERLRQRGANNVCHRLGVAFSMLFLRAGQAKRKLQYPVRVAGSGVAGLTFFMTDGSVIKVVEFSRAGRAGRSKRSKRAGRASLLLPSGLAAGGHSIPRDEFMHEIRMTGEAHRMFGNAPRVLRWVVLKGKFGSTFGIMQLSKAKGVPLTEAIEKAGRSSAAALALARRHGKQVARTHAKDFSHGDMHSQNVMVHGGRLTMIDFGRATSKRLVERYTKNKPWEAIRLFDVAAPYRDHARSHSVAVADAFLGAYVAELRAAGKALPKGIDRIRDDYDDLVFDNLDSVLNSVNMIARGVQKRLGGR
jgi:tRNA A-37 threonylcarbamoyl transferase component Bud32